MKKWYQSKTIILAVAQGLIGLVVAFESVYPELSSIGLIVIFKSLVDIVLRMNTDEKVM